MVWVRRRECAATTIAEQADAAMAAPAPRIPPHLSARGDMFTTTAATARTGPIPTRARAAAPGLGHAVATTAVASADTTKTSAATTNTFWVDDNRSRALADETNPMRDRSTRPLAAQGASIAPTATMAAASETPDSVRSARSDIAATLTARRSRRTQHAKWPGPPERPGPFSERVADRVGQQAGITSSPCHPCHPCHPSDRRPAWPEQLPRACRR